MAPDSHRSPDTSDKLHREDSGTQPFTNGPPAGVAFTRIRGFLSSPLAWVVAIISSCAAVALFEAAPIAWLATGYLFVSTAGWHHALRGRQALRQRLLAAEIRGNELEQLLVAGAACTGTQSVALDSATAAIHETLHTAAGARNDKGRAELGSTVQPADSSHGLTYLSQGEEAEREAGAPQRRTRRLPQEMLFSNLGRILDLSRGGVRIRVDGKHMPEGSITLDILAEDGPLRVQAEVVWTKVDKRFRDAGMRFVNLAPDAADRITAICMQHRCRTSMTERSRV